jgi:hypothetical protein
VDTVTILDGESPRALYEHVPDGAQPPTELAWSPALLPLPITRVAGRCLRPYGDRQRIRVREQAAEIVAAVGPAALEIIAAFRAQRWAFTAAYRKDPVGGELARARAAEWQRIATSVSMLMTL